MNSLFDMEFLYQHLKEKAYDLDIPKPKIPKYISSNLKYNLFAWQEDALKNFIVLNKIKAVENPTSPTHLMFNMATGAGKTLVMAATILYYYNKGYRNFLFFVNQNNIVGKTEDNLTDPYHSKYLFTSPIVIDGKTVEVKKVDVFSDDTDDIEIMFTSIHKLHNLVYKVAENQIFLEDLQNRKLVMLADEAHHLNAATKSAKQAVGKLEFATELKENASAADVEKCWEHTVTNLLLCKGETKNCISENVLLEFTATIPSNANIVAKYEDKIISKFELKDFLKAGYTKEINLVSSSFNNKQRILQALLFNWYRHRIGRKYALPHFKPVILFKSKYADSALEGNVMQDYKFFREIIDELSVSDFDFLKTIEKEKAEKIYEVGQSRIVDIVNYIQNTEGIDFNDVIIYLQDAFKENNCIITSSKDKNAKGLDGKEKTTGDQDRILNSLEDRNNHISAVFTCQRLTEGWDVLNLFDIVRMYEGQNTGGSNKGKAGNSTTSEVQLIGRGVRYYPFKYDDKVPNQRKFDKELDHELRVLEEFYFHSDKDERYISELKAELKRQELLPEKEKTVKHLDIKEEIKNDKDSFYNTLVIFGNEAEKNPLRKKTNLDDLKESFVMPHYRVPFESISEQQLRLDKEEDDVRLNKTSENSRTSYKTVAEIADQYRHILYKSYNMQAKKHNSLFRFSNLKEEFEINSVEDLWDEKILGKFHINYILPKSVENFEEIPVENKLAMLNQFFSEIEIALQEIINPKIGSEFKSYAFSSVFDKPKQIAFEETDKSKALETKLLEKDWYALDGYFGTSEEDSLVKFLESTIENFRDSYNNVYLLRNEEVYKIYDFEKGRGFMPDFLFFLKSKNENLYYQIFIEPKGLDRITNENSRWKQKFLDEITEKYGNEIVLKEENKDYKLIGLPLYNASSEPVFRKAVNEYFEISI